MSKYKSRIVGTDVVPAGQLLANPLNWRIHPQEQQNALNLVLSEVGWVDDVIVNKRTGHIIDGHLRVTLALRHGEDTPVPVKYVDLSEEEEARVLATFDPIGAMAKADEGILTALLDQIDEITDDVRGALQSAISDVDLESIIGDDSPEEPAEYVSATLRDRFIVPPFSILDARQGYWQKRKRAWVSLGLKGELGRIDTKVSGSLSGTIPGYYWYKRDAEKKLGHPISHDEFVREHLKNYLPEESIIAQTNTGGVLSIFDPVLTELMYRWFCPPGGRVLDPFAGGSERGIVASVLGREYVGIELREKQVLANRAQAERIVPDSQPTWIIGDSRDLPSLVEGEFDFVLTCPPYFNLEVYSNDPRDLSNAGDYESFLEMYEEIIRHTANALRENRFAVIVVQNIRGRDGTYHNLVGDTIEAFGRVGMRLYNDAILVTPLGSLPVRVIQQFQNMRKMGKAHQNVLVFIKGDAREAMAEIGEIDLDVDPESLAAWGEDDEAVENRV